MDLSVVIVSANHAQYLATCLESLKPTMRCIESEVMVVDNLSDDGSANVVREHLPTARLLLNSVKRGFSANNNTAIRLATGRYVLILNPDTEVLSNALETLIAFMDAHPQAGLCGPQLRFPDGSVQLSCRQFPTWCSFLARRTPLRRYLWKSSLNTQHLMANINHTQIQEVDWMLGACLMVRQTAIDDVGLMDEGFYLYVEDIDWCYRMHQHGWGVFYVPTAQVIHHHLAVTDHRWWTRRTLIHYQSMGRFIWKHYLRPRYKSQLPAR